MFIELDCFDFSIFENISVLINAWIPLRETFTER